MKKEISLFLLLLLLGCTQMQTSDIPPIPSTVPSALEPASVPMPEIDENEPDHEPAVESPSEETVPPEETTINIANSVSIGYVGCSNTVETVEGYHRVGGIHFWEPDRAYNGGAVSDWSQGTTTGNKFWDAFDQHLEENPKTNIIWWELCVREEESPSYADAVRVLDAIRERIPDATIYISPLPEYVDQPSCGITGIAGIQHGYLLAQELDAKNDDVFQGPELGPMSPAETDSDGCHLSQEGKETLGDQMKEFFDEYLLGEPESEEEEELSFEDRVWQQRIDAALAPSDCPTVSGPTYGTSYYKGPLIDTHYHIPHLPDYPPWEEEDDTDDRFPLLGENIRISDIVCTLEQENTMRVFAFFPIYPELDRQLLQVANRTMDQYPDKFVPFIMPPENDNDPDGFPTVDADTLQNMLEDQSGLFRGYGEIGLYAREGGADELPPDSPRLLKIYPVLREYHLIPYFHLGEGHKDNLERVAEQNPDINFIFHGDQLSVEEVEEVIANHPNVFYTIDELYGDQWLIRPEVSKEEFISTLADYEPLLRKDLRTWKDVIESHPDQFMWGTDRSDQVLWSHDPEIGQALANYGRAFIARLDPDVQEKFAYKNAERLLGEENFSNSN